MEKYFLLAKQIMSALYRVLKLIIFGPFIFLIPDEKSKLSSASFVIGFILSIVSVGFLLVGYGILQAKKASWIKEMQNLSFIQHSLIYFFDSILFFLAIFVAIIISFLLGIILANRERKTKSQNNQIGSDLEKRK